MRSLMLGLVQGCHTLCVNDCLEGRRSLPNEAGRTVSKLALETSLWKLSTGFGHGFLLDIGNRLASTDTLSFQRCASCKAHARGKTPPRSASAGHEHRTVRRMLTAHACPRARGRSCCDRNVPACARAPSGSRGELAAPWDSGGSQPCCPRHDSASLST